MKPYGLLVNLTVYMIAHYLIFFLKKMQVLTLCTPLYAPTLNYNHKMDNMEMIFLSKK
jgi:hypothetical protein